MKFLEFFGIDEHGKAAIKSYLRAVLAAGATVAIALSTDIAPEYAILIGAILGPLAKYADKGEKDYGLGSNEHHEYDPI